eukprot:RCo033644
MTSTGRPLFERPKVEPPGGRYPQPLHIQITSPGAKVYYTLDGSYPGPSGGSTLYTGPVVLSQCGKFRIRVLAVKEVDYHKTYSQEAEEVYEVQEPGPPPTAATAPGASTSGPGSSYFSETMTPFPGQPTPSPGRRGSA